MEKPNNDDSQHIDSIRSPAYSISQPTELNMNWQTKLSQSEPSIEFRQNQLYNRLASTAYKVSIGHETVNITEIARHRESISDSTKPVLSSHTCSETSSKKNATILSLCFMCFVSASFILITISTMDIILKQKSVTNNDFISNIIQSTNMTVDLFRMLDEKLTSKNTVSNVFIPAYDPLIRELAATICLLIILLNCFCVLIFSIEIYLGSNKIRANRKTFHLNYLFSSSTSRFIAICSFFASIPSYILGNRNIDINILILLSLAILVMCLFILLNMSLIPAIMSLSVLGCGLIFILMTLLTYFSVWENKPINCKLGGLNSSIYHTTDATHSYDDDIDITKTDELSTLV